MKNKFYLFATVLATLIIVVLAILRSGRKKNIAKSNLTDELVYKPVTPRTLHGIDTIRAADSLYIIKFKVIKVIPDTIECESQYKYDKNDFTSNITH